MSPPIFKTGAMHPTTGMRHMRKMTCVKTVRLKPPWLQKTEASVLTLEAFIPKLKTLKGLNIRWETAVKFRKNLQTRAAKLLLLKPSNRKAKTRQKCSVPAGRPFLIILKSIRKRISYTVKKAVFRRGHYQK